MVLIILYTAVCFLPYQQHADRPELASLHTHNNWWRHQHFRPQSLHREMNNIEITHTYMNMYTKLAAP